MWSNPYSEHGELKSGCSWLCPLKFGLSLAMEVLDSVGKLSKTPVESAELSHCAFSIYSETLRGLCRYIKLVYSKRYQSDFVSLETYY